MTGRKSGESYYHFVFDENHTELTSEYREVNVRGDLAYCRGYAEVKLIPKKEGIRSIRDQNTSTSLQDKRMVAGKPLMLSGIAIFYE